VSLPSHPSAVSRIPINDVKIQGRIALKLSLP
jgi:hypothetical protein